MTERKLGPNVKKLLAHFIAREAVPSGGGLADGLHFLTDPVRRRQGLEMAMSNLDAALAAVKSAPDNPYGDDDEAIAAAIIERVERKAGYFFPVPAGESLNGVAREKRFRHDVSSCNKSVFVR